MFIYIVAYSPNNAENDNEVVIEKAFRTQSAAEQYIASEDLGCGTFYIVPRKLED